jgi:mono/diheme cytochrome c family protein
MRGRFWRLTIPVGLALLWAAAIHGADSQPATSPAAPDLGLSLFTDHVRPILEAHCVECHGGKSTKNGLNLTTREGLLRGGDDGPAIVTGQASVSLLYRRITHEAEPGMPYQRDKLSAEQIGRIAEWINAGASYDKPLTWHQDEEDVWWSLQPLKKGTPPETKNKTWARTPIDQFILAKLEEKGLAPSTAADKRTLLRRVNFDLTGLPPTPEEMRAFLADESLDAFAKVVDRLLASPRYGERWARHWLDIVHYADTHGNDQDRPRPNAWPYRDYLIRAFNEDKPYARFVEEQLAGDILYPDEPPLIVATGFIAAGPWDESSQMSIMGDTIDKKIARNLDRDDMVMTTMSTFVSATAHCARCHNHKFDPISQAEYYSLQAVFAGVDRADRPYDVDAQTSQKRRPLLAKLKELESKEKLSDRSLLEPAIQAEVAAWEKTPRGNPTPWTVLDPATFTSAHDAVLTKQADLSVLASGPAPEVDNYTVVVHTDVKNITGIRLELLPDDSLPLHGPGRQNNGNLHLTEFKLKAAPRSNPSSLQIVALQNASADFNQEAWGVARAIDGDGSTAWGIHPEIGKQHYAVFETKDNVSFDGGTTLTFVLEQQHGRTHTIGRFRLSVTNVPRPVRVDELPTEISAILAVAPEQRTEPQKIELTVYYLKDKTLKELAALPPAQMVYAAASDFKPQGNFTPAITPRPVHVLRRGDILRPEAEALPGALACVRDIPHEFKLPDPNNEGARRAALAKWITNPKNMLTWRSIVNRVWHYHFGRGLVDTPNDFGRMGSTPTHPELLDWLACSFLEAGGSIKQLHRWILTSAVYQQSSMHNAEFAKVDADNHYLWRMNRSRLDAESVRDTVLQLTGMLDLTMGGPPVMHFHYEDIEPGRTPVADYGRFDVDSPQSLRRSIYRYIFRTKPDPFMDSLDCPDAGQIMPVRNISVTALQAMAMLNDPFILRQCEHLAERLQKDSGDLKGQIEAAYELALGRPPTSAEVEILVTYATKHGLPNACRVILNCNEFMFVN